MTDILDLARNLSLVVVLFYPGSIFVAVYLYFSNRKKVDSVGYLISCVLISIIFHHLITLVFPSIDMFVYLATTGIASLGLGIAAARLRKSRLVNSLFLRIAGQSINSKFWTDVIDPEGTFAYIVCGKNEYLGHIRIHETNGTMAALYDHEILINGKEREAIHENPSCLIVDLSKADYIEFGYNKNSRYASI